MRKPLLATLIVTSILCTCSCGVVGGEKLYTEEEFLAALESKYDADFEVVDSDQINNWQRLNLLFMYLPLGIIALKSIIRS